jgi:glycine dehydrogenase subunit 1
VHPEYRETLRTYAASMELTLVGDETLANGPAQLAALVDGDTACLVVQNPDFLGRMADLAPLAQAAHAHGALLVVVAYPIALGMLKAPGDMGADIVVGEGQPLGNALNYGGPYLGYFACKQDLVRRMSGRLVGQTVDAAGQRGFVLTLSTREQHIRREKATSNICTNQGLNALAAAIYMAAMGKCGLAQVAQLCYHRAHYAARAINGLQRYQVDLKAPFFNEFVVRCPRPVAEINDALLAEGDIIGGLDLESFYPALKNQMLVCVTEMNSRDQIDRLAQALREVAA